MNTQTAERQRGWRRLTWTSVGKGRKGEALDGSKHVLSSSLTIDTNESLRNLSSDDSDSQDVRVNQPTETCVVAKTLYIGCMDGEAMGNDDSTNVTEVTESATDTDAKDGACVSTQKVEEKSTPRISSDDAQRAEHGCANTKPDLDCSVEAKSVCAKRMPSRELPSHETPVVVSARESSAELGDLIFETRRELQAESFVTHDGAFFADASAQTFASYDGAYPSFTGLSQSEEWDLNVDGEDENSPDDTFIGLVIDESMVASENSKQVEERASVSMDAVAEEGLTEGLKSPRARRGIFRQPTPDVDTMRYLAAESRFSVKSFSALTRRGGKRSGPLSEDVEDGSNSQPLLIRRSLFRQPTPDACTMTRLAAESGSSARSFSSQTRRGGRRNAEQADVVDETTTINQGEAAESKGPMLTRRGVVRQPTPDTDTMSSLAAESRSSLRSFSALTRRGGRRQAEQTVSVAEVASGDLSEAVERKGPLLTRRGIQRQPTPDADTMTLQAVESRFSVRSFSALSRRGGKRQTEQTENIPSEGCSDEGNAVVKKGLLLTRRGIQRQPTPDADTMSLQAAGSRFSVRSLSNLPRRGGRRTTEQVGEIEECGSSAPATSE